MRAPKTADGRTQPFNEALCRATARMRRRMAEMAARIDLLEALLLAERDGIAAERRALVTQLESPEAALHVARLARGLLRDAALAAVSRRALCEACGGLGAGMTRALMDAPIAAFCREHGLDDADAPAPDWPRVPAGYFRSRDWLQPVRREERDWR